MFPVLVLFGLIWLLSGAVGSTPPRRLLSSAAKSDKPPERLLEDVAKNVRVTSTSVVPYVGDTSVCRLGLPIEQEVFTPPLSKGKHYKLVFAGTCAVKKHSDWYGLDACYFTDSNFNYRHRHQSLRLNDKPLEAQPTEEDRAEHRYTFPYHSKGGRLAVMLELPSDLRRASFTYENTLHVTVVELAATKESLEAILRGRGIEEHKRQEELQKRALELATLAHLESNFLDQEYRQRYAETYRTKVLGSEKGVWLDEYRQVIADQELSTLIDKEHPHIMPFLEMRLEVIRIAERLAVQPAPETPDPEPAPEPKRKETPEEWRDRRLSRLRGEADYKISKMLQRYESARRLREEAEKKGLDEDTIERLEQELLGDLDQDDEDTGRSFKQL